jgi:hypothetical protein
MTIKNRLFRVSFCCAAFWIVLSYGRAVYAERVTEKEALDIAEFWYPAEVNFYDQKHWKRHGNENKSDLLAAAQVSRVWYLVGQDAIVDKVKGNEEVFAYVIEFFPKGYVVIAGDDGITPLLMFNIDGDFIWGDSETDSNIGAKRGFLNQYALDAQPFIKGNKNRSDKTVHATWTRLRSMVETQKDLSPDQKSYTADETLVKSSSTANSTSFVSGLAAAALLGGTPDPFTADILLPTAEWAQGGNYNDVVQNPMNIYLVHPTTPPSGWNGGDGVPTGCNQTALAIILRYHEWPIRVRGSASRFDFNGEVNGADFIAEGTTTFNWGNMPTSDINLPPPTGTPNNDIATLMWNVGAVTCSDWEVGYTSGCSNPPEWNSHLRYRDTTLYDAQYSQGNRAHSLPESNCSGDTWGGHDYLFCPNLKTWANAQASCTNVGMNLVRIDNGDNDPDTVRENEYITNVITALGWSRAWIGASDVSTEGTWKWTDGTVFWSGGPASAGGGPVGGLYSNWDAGEPNNSGNEDCGEIHSDGKWNDRTCGYQQYYICEVPVEQSAIALIAIASLERGLPVFTGEGWQDGNGHAVVIDGFRTSIPTGDLWGPDSYFHVNPGWGVGSSGWFAMLNFPGGSGIFVQATGYMAPENYVYVQPDGSDSGTGGPSHPYRTIQKGIDNIPAVSNDNPTGGKLWINAAGYSYASAVEFNRPMRITTWNGSATINGRLTIHPSTEIIIAHNTSDLKVYP